ncbi:nuclear transport factor 2 family protein [Streptomyces niveus]|uniref:nuclear transport factor 2 family protein n=1 Tax=Streptomyces niveus TaxID=193462 RepID=UPI00363170C7
MSDETVHETLHEIDVDAPAGAVFDLVADAPAWPAHFPPSVHVERLEGDDRQERLRIWATANGEIKTWTSHRVLDPEGLRVTYRQEKSQPPVRGMSGEWQLEPLDERRTRVRFIHRFSAVDDDPRHVEWIRRAIDTNTGSELEALRAGVEDADPRLTFSFDDSVRVDGSAKDAYEFIRAADRWTERLPHVARVVLTEDSPNEQILEMDTRTAAGDIHTTRSVRICFPAERIVYKQIRTPALMAAHTGEWIFEEDEEGCTVTSRHTVRIAPDAVTEVIGEHAGVPEARALIREALGRNSRATLEHAATYARAPRDAGPVSAELYVGVQRFYAEQMRLLDERRAEDWAGTFTEDGVFAQNTGPEPVRGRDAIAAAVRQNLARLSDTPQQRRHVFSMLTVEPGADGAVRARSYAQVLATPPGGPTVLRVSTVCEDELVPYGDAWLVRHRRVEHDGV